jgi:hypothetical protein
VSNRFNRKFSGIAFASILGAAFMVCGAASDAAAANRFGVAAMFRSDVDFGIQGRMTAPLTDKVDIVPQAGYFFDPEFWDFNLDFQLGLAQEEKLDIYGFAGPNLATDFDNSEFGINIGAGLATPLTDSLQGFAELKYVISDLDGIALHLGLNF